MTRQIIQVTTLEQLRSALNSLKQPIGFVPTMGYLHEGHISLVRKARQECASVVASIFVNPSQFGPSEDLANYPRDLPRDLRLLEEAGADLVWTPTSEEIYPDDYSTWVQVDGVSEGLEGAQRPGHFRGVATVVAKLFNAVQPQRAYFGQKDAQQCAVIQRMTRDLDLPVEIVVCPIVRESDGLAMSSRNVYLNADERRAATVLYRALSAAKSAHAKGERNAEQLRTAMRKVLGAEPLARVQYVSCADAGTLKEIEAVQRTALLSMAVFVGKTRLIDNMLLE